MKFAETSLNDEDLAPLPDPAWSFDSARVRDIPKQSHKINHDYGTGHQYPRCSVAVSLELWRAVDHEDQKDIKKDHHLVQTGDHEREPGFRPKQIHTGQGREIDATDGQQDVLEMNAFPELCVLHPLLLRDSQHINDIIATRNNPHSATLDEWNIVLKRSSSSLRTPPSVSGIR